MAANDAKGNGSESRTLAVVQRFIEAFQRKDTRAIADLVAEDCVMETMQPAPDGDRIEGYAENVRFWQAMVSDSNGSFETEDLIVCREWRSTAGAIALAEVTRNPCAA